MALTNINAYNIQVLGVVPADSNSQAHQVIGELQDVLGDSGLTMETTPLVTILNRGRKQVEGSDVQKLEDSITAANGQDGFLGPLALQANMNNTSLFWMMYIKL